MNCFNHNEKPFHTHENCFCEFENYGLVWTDGNEYKKKWMCECCGNILFGDEIKTYVPQIVKKVRQVRDALNKCKDAEIIEQIATLLKV